MSDETKAGKIQRLGSEIFSKFNKSKTKVPKAETMTKTEKLFAYETEKKKFKETLKNTTDKIYDPKLGKFVDTHLTNKPKVSMTKIIIFIIIIIISILISLQDILVDGVEAAVDCVSTPVTVGTLGVLTGTGELVDEIVSEMIQDILIALIAIPMGGGSRNTKIVQILIVVGCSLIDIIASVIGIFIPCVMDVINTILEIFTEIVQNSILIYSFYKLF